MAHIKKIMFESVSRQEGCTCDRCGQYIKNIWTVEYLEGLTMHYGLDCWNVVRGNLNAYGKKLMDGIMKQIRMYCEWRDKFITGELNEDTDIQWKNEQSDPCSAWYGQSYDEYKSWMLDDFFPYRIGESEKELAKFKKVNFEA